MKKAIAVLTTSIMCFVLGVEFHGVVFSLFDRTDRLPMKTMDSRETLHADLWCLPPHMAADIGTLVLNRSFFQETVGRQVHVYADANDFFVLDTFPNGVSVCSYYARLLGVRIARSNGKIYNRSKGRWETHGYIHDTADNVMAFLSVGMTEAEVTRRLGYPFGMIGREGGVKMATDGRAVVGWRYRCRDKIIVVVFEQSGLVGVETNDSAVAL